MADNINLTAVAGAWKPTRAGRDHVVGTSDAGKHNMLTSPMNDKAKVTTAYNVTNVTVQRYWQQRAASASRPATPQQVGAGLRIPGVRPDQVPGGESALAFEVRRQSGATNVVLGMEERRKDFAEEHEHVPLTAQSSYRGRPKTGRQWG